MIPIELLRTNIEQDVFDYTHLMEILSGYKKPRDVVTNLLKQNKIIRLRKGLYCFTTLWQKAPVSKEMLANLVYGPSAISLDYALAHYGLIPEQVSVFTSVTPGRSRFYDTPVGRFSYIHLPQPFYSFGLTIEKLNLQQWLIMQPLKALADKVWTDKRFVPTSPGSFSEYFFQDLRIDETTLTGYINKNTLLEIETNYSTKKIRWMIDFLTRYKS